MPAVANGLEHRGIAAKAVSIAPLGIACLEERFEVVEHQQTGPIPQELENHPEPLAFADGRHQLLVRQEVDGPRQPLAGGQSITHTAPVHAIECWRHVLGQLRGEHRLADAAHAQHGCNPTVLSDQPGCARSPSPRYDLQIRAHPVPRPSPGVAPTSALLRPAIGAGLYVAPIAPGELTDWPTTPRRMAFACAAPGATPRPKVPRPRRPQLPL